MENIAVTMGRVAEIRDRIMPAPPAGGFAAHLEKQLDRPAEASRVMLERKPLQALPSAPSHVHAGNAADLDSFLAAHDIKNRNGRLEGSGLLVEVSGGWHGNGKLLAPAAEAWEQMRAAAAADGIDLKAIDMYRSYEVQAGAYQAYLDGRKKANVLPPGRSEHGNGLAVDITNGSLVGPGDPEWHWLGDNAGRFGWHPISNESWHWEYRG